MKGKLLEDKAPPVEDAPAKFVRAQSNEDTKAAKPAEVPKVEPQPEPKPDSEMSPRERQIQNRKAKDALLAAAAAAPPPHTKPANENAQDGNRVRPAATNARARRRHIALMVFFVQLVLLPTAIAAWYLFFEAEDQYASHVGFTVRKEESGTAIELLGGITELSGSSSNDTDILFEFIQSQNMVRKVDARIDLATVYHRDNDPIFSLGDDVRIEALSGYWGRMVDVFYDRSSGLIEIRVKAFDPDSAQAIATAIFEESSILINELSAEAQADATRFAEQELEIAVERLKAAQGSITAFRTRTQIVDPIADIQGRRDDDPRVIQGQRRVEVIEDRIRLERLKFSEGGEQSQDQAYSELVGEYEALAVDQQFAQEAYVLSLASFNGAVAQAQRQSRYLGSYIDPTLAETSEYPRRYVLLFMLFGTLFVCWSILSMVFYSIRDRR